MGFVIGGLAFLLILSFFWSNIVINIRAGEAGVLWSRVRGTLTDRVYPEGVNIVLPWNVMTIYNVRYQTVERSFLVLSRDGLEITVEVAVRFKPLDRLVPKLHQQVGPGYIDTIVTPEVNTAVRTVIGRYRPDELYAATYQEIQGDIVTLARQRVRNRFVLIDDVLIRTIVLPPVVAAAIQRKLEQEQASLEMQYRLARERQEADRKRIEADGIRDYQEAISSTLNDRLLLFKGIEATTVLAQSTNAKVVVIGAGENGLPLILGADALTQPGSTTPAEPGSVPVPAPAPPNRPAAVAKVPAVVAEAAPKVAPPR